MTYILAHNPTHNFIQTMDGIATQVNIINNEILYRILPDVDFDIMEFQDEDVDRSKTRFSTISTDQNLNKRLYLCDFSDDKLAEIFAKEHPGGDIRKYFYEQYAGVDYTISCNVGRSILPHLMGYEPVKIDTIKNFENQYSINTYNNNKPLWYPNFNHITNWYELVSNRWNTEMRVTGKLHIKEGEKPEFGIDGIALLNASEDIRQWADSLWNESSKVDDLLSDEELYAPTEFDFVETDPFIEVASKSGLVDYTTPYIRMWWD